MAFQRCCDNSGEISKKHGSTRIRTLRKHYGHNFAPGCRDSEKLRKVLKRLDRPSQRKLFHDHEAGKMEQIWKA